MSPSQQWLERRGWEAFAFQREVWDAIREGRSGLLHATTGSGKTYAVWLGILDELIARHPPPESSDALPAVDDVLVVSWRHEKAMCFEGTFEGNSQ